MILTVQGGEQPLPKNGACCLASLNLSEFVVNPYTDEAYFNFADFFEAVKIAINCLDTLIDENYYRHPLKAQQEMSFNYRNIGLGVFGYATMLMKLGMIYGNDQSINFTSNLFKGMFRAAVSASNELAKEKGTFPKYKEYVWDSDIIKAAFSPMEIDEMRPYGLRNCSLISIAPNGSIATFLGESGGCEPEFAIKYTRRTVGMTDGDDTYYTVYCKAAKEYMKLHPETTELPEWFISSSEIPYVNRVATQGAMQKYVDTAISSTVNMPNSATKKDVADMYIQAWRAGCKGITMFRDGCKRLGILTTDNTPTNSSENELKRGDWKPIADDTVYYNRKLRIGCGDLKLFIGWSEKEQLIQDIYVKKAGIGGCERLEESTAIAISAILRLGGTIENIEKAFKGIGACPSFVAAGAKGKELSRGSSCGAAILNAMRDFINERVKPNETTEIVSGDKCPECGSIVVQEGGCIVCKNCGWSKCG